MLYVLVHRPDVFQRYICGSGDLYVAYPYVVRHDAQLAARKAPAPSYLYLSAGELEEKQFPFFHQLAAYLGQGDNPGLNVVAEVYPGVHHGAEGLVLTYLHGIRQVYPA